MSIPNPCDCLCHEPLCGGEHPNRPCKCKRPPTVAVCIPSIPPRKAQLARALSTVLNQDMPVNEIIVMSDTEHEGAAATRNRAWRASSSEFVAFLDDDDELDPNHLSTLVEHQQATKADLVFPWHRVLRYGQRIADVLPQRGIKDKRIVWELRNGNFIPINVLVRRSMLEQVGGFPLPGTEAWPHETAEDWGCWLALADAGAKFSHVDKETWTWHHWGWGTPEAPGNTSGDPTRW